MPSFVGGHAAVATHGGVLVAACGDSITARGGDWPYVYPGYGYLTWAQMLSGGRIRYAGHFGVGGYTAAQIRDTQVPRVLAASPKPHYCLVLGLANDEDKTGQDALDAMAAIEGAWKALRDGGVEPIAVSVTPRTSASATQRANIAMFNDFIAQRTAELGIMFIDVHAALASTAGEWPSGTYTEDNLHPSGIGYKAMGQVISDRLCGPLPSGTLLPLGGPLPFATPRLLADNADGFNLLGSNMMFINDADSNGLADNVNMIGYAGTPTFSLITDSAIKGKWQQLGSSSGASDYTYVGLGAPFAVTPGHKYRWSGRMELISADAAAGAQLYWYNNDGSGHLVPGADGPSHILWLGTHATGGGVFDYQFTMPSLDDGGGAISSSGLALLLNGGAISVKLAQMQVVDLTALGA